jgi:hypothetical protein
MKMTSLLLIVLVVLLGFSTTADAQRRRGGAMAEAAESRNAPKLPDTVAKAVAATFPGATVGEFEQDSEEGVTLYIVDLSNGAEVEVTASGVVLVASYDTSMQQIPAPAAQALQQAGAGAALDGVQRAVIYAELFEGGKVVRLPQPRTEYSATFKKGGQLGEISVTADGTVVEPMEWGADD